MWTGKQPPKPRSGATIRPRPDTSLSHETASPAGPPAVSRACPPMQYPATKIPMHAAAARARRRPPCRHPPPLNDRLGNGKIWSEIQALSQLLVLVLLLLVHQGRPHARAPGCGGARGRYMSEYAELKTAARQVRHGARPARCCARAARDLRAAGQPRLCVAMKHHLLLLLRTIIITIIIFIIIFITISFITSFILSIIISFIIFVGDFISFVSISVPSLLALFVLFTSFAFPSFRVYCCRS